MARNMDKGGIIGMTKVPGKGRLSLMKCKERGLFENLIRKESPMKMSIRIQEECGTITKVATFVGNLVICCTFCCDSSIICTDVDLVQNTRIRIFQQGGSTHTARMGNLHSTVNRFEEGSIVDYNPAKDQYFVVFHGKKDRWMQLSGMDFKLVSMKPIGSLVNLPICNRRDGN
jgi:hypothetical protein